MTFDEALIVAAETLAFDLTPAQIDLYERICSGYTDEQLTGAVMAHLRQSQWFPKPAEIIALIEGDATDAATLQWGAVFKAIARIGSYRTPEFDDPRTVNAINALGGWTHLCRMTTAEEPFRRKDFISAYTAAHREQLRPLQGRIESQNSDAHALSHIREKIHP